MSAQAATDGRGRLAIYWAASCGGCEISVLGLHERILEVTAHFDLVFCPCLVDTKRADVESWDDRSIDVTLFNGSIRSSEQEYMARLMRRKSKVLVAYGSCAHEGCIPGLGNMSDAAAIMDTAYADTPSTINPDGVRPRTSCEVDGVTLTLPALYDVVKTLGQCVDVDFTLPGCPPEPDRLWDAIQALVRGDLPPAGTVFGSQTTVCDECSRTRTDKRIKAFKRTFEIIPDATTCLLDLGLVCSGIATRAGCGAKCPVVNAPCIGCYGPCDDIEDHGAHMMSVLASVIDSEDPDEIARIIAEGIPDPVGVFYRFGLPASHLRGAARRDDGGE